MTQITGGLFSSFSWASSSSFKSSSMTSTFSSFSQMISYSMAIFSASSKEISEFTVTICPCRNNFLIITEGCNFILSASSFMVRESGMVMTLICSSTTSAAFFSGLMKRPALFLLFTAASSSS